MPEITEEPVDNDLKPPDAILVNHRWISQDKCEWAEEANRILLRHGAVEGRRVYDKRHQARWGAQRLMRLLEELRLRERWEMGEHVERIPGGYKWTVEYKGK